MTVFILSFMSCFLLWPIGSSAELYKWTDDQGNFHITDTPPPVLQKKSAATAIPPPQSMLPKKATVRPTLPEQSPAPAHPVPASRVAPPSTKEVSVQPSLEGLTPNQATLLSPWQTFEGTQVNTKAPVQRWTDEQGLDHFADVLPAAKINGQVTSKVEDVFVSRSIASAKERTAGASRTRHHASQ